MTYEAMISRDVLLRVMERAAGATDGAGAFVGRAVERGFWLWHRTVDDSLQPGHWTLAALHEVGEDRASVTLDCDAVGERAVARIRDAFGWSAPIVVQHALTNGALNGRLLSPRRASLRWLRLPVAVRVAMVASIRERGLPWLGGHKELAALHETSAAVAADVIRTVALFGYDDPYLLGTKSFDDGERGDGVHVAPGALAP